jgi:23S rRNA pseudoU1915 N3-methylase RlmH
LCQGLCKPRDHASRIMKIRLIEELTTLFQSYLDQGIRLWTFVIGGPLEVARSVVKKADHILFFSKMTFTHDMTLDSCGADV